MYSFMVAWMEITKIAASLEKPEWQAAHFEEELVQWKLYHLKCELLSSGIHIDVSAGRN